MATPACAIAPSSFFTLRPSFGIKDLHHKEIFPGGGRVREEAHYCTPAKGISRSEIF
jgi:hypothetical protein